MALRYISGVRRHLFRSLLALCISSPLFGFGQGIQVHTKPASTELELKDLLEEEVVVPGVGRDVPGIELDEWVKARHGFGDDPRYAERSFADTAWTRLIGSRDSVVPGNSVHWIRFHLRPAAELKGERLLLQVSSAEALDIFLNGKSILRAPASVRSSMHHGRPLADSVARITVPFVFACDGQPEIIAVRVQGKEGGSLRAAQLVITTHVAGSVYAAQRHVMHLGVFIGVNLIILLLALIIWSYERKERTWLLLAMLAGVSALDTFCELGYSSGSLGYATGITNALRFISALLTPWPMYLLIMVLGLLHGNMSHRRAKWYTINVLTITLICACYALGVSYGLLDGGNGISLLKDAPVLILITVVFAIIFAAGITWFAIDLVRHGIRLLRARGYERWVGGGALASSLVSIVLHVLSGGSASGFSGWLSVVGDYCSYVAVPVSVAIFLAVRSAHHNRLVARQRDELDEEVKQRTAQLSAEKERSDELLLNILPHEVAEELKRTGAAEARHFDEATVMFTDFKGFTALSEQVSPAELLEELNACFKAFDDIIGAHGIEKIKTIGDAYMAAGGLPDPGNSRPVDVVHAALEMQTFMQKRRTEREAAGLPAFEMRVGIHTGPVVAGIVGVKKFQYDIWGDTVNTASRMESSGEVGLVNISWATYAHVKDAIDLSFEPRGRVNVKGKGEVEMYFVRRSEGAKV